ncbi:hypothetical protein THAOC_08319 [Thalassiosira oceanica]|uniref:Uncharacterized protein n=1 Tax=Thalassiosira oceanica TaxID=159749 RepID=K0SVA8_THAOC|nr:hypothetical protein THAOC_08319 [Thalassiosira oceanica]|eukprot:EJK70328.1 hypothetical protein THAOC_08319 [Thalassiosira oceanica]
MEDAVDDASGTGEYKRFDPKALSRPPSKKRDGTPVESAEETEDGPWVVLLDNFVSEAEAGRFRASWAAKSEVDDDEPLYLFFSDDGGHSYYNADAPYPAYSFDDGDELQFAIKVFKLKCSKASRNIRFPSN